MTSLMAGRDAASSGHHAIELPNKFTWLLRMPLGVSASLSWNFPIAIPAWNACRTHRRNTVVQARLLTLCP